MTNTDTYNYYASK